MKKQYETPVANVSMFHGENVITTSGDNAVGMAAQMAQNGYTVTTKSLTELQFTW